MNIELDKESVFRVKLKNAVDRVLKETSVVKPDPPELSSAAAFTDFLGNLPQYNPDTTEEEFLEQQAVTEAIHKALNGGKHDDTNV